MVPVGGTVGLQMDFIFSLFTPPTFVDNVGWWGYCTVDCGSCAVYALLLIFKLRTEYKYNLCFQ